MAGLADTGKTVLVAGLAAGAAAVAGLAAGLAVCVQAAAEEQVGIAKLGAAVTASGGNWDEASVAIEAYLVAQTKRAALDDGAGREALSRLTTATGSYQKAMELLPIAMDLAAAKGIDLATASELVGKVANGNTAILSRYGITLEEGATATEALAAMQKTFGGQAEAYGNTMAGQQAKIGIAFGNLKETIGAALLPVVTNIMEKFSTWATDLMPKLEAAIAIISPIITTLAEYFTELVASGDPLNDYLAELPAGIQPIVFWFGNVVATIRDDVIPTIGRLVVPIQEFISKHAEAFKNALLAIGAVLIGAAVLGAIVEVGAVIAALANPVTAVIVAVGLLAAAWTEDWGGIRTQLTAWWEQTGKPIFDQLVLWMETNIPRAIAVLTAFWTGTLEPALQQVWTYIQTNILPIFSEVSDWLSAKIPVAIDTVTRFFNDILLPVLDKVWKFIRDDLIPLYVSLYAWMFDKLVKAAKALADFWTNTLWPALQKVWDFIDKYIIPIFEVVARWLGQEIPTASAQTSGFWTETLLPAFTAVWGFIDTKILPIFEAIRSWLSDRIAPATEGLAKIWTDTLYPAMEAVRNWIETKLMPYLTLLKDLVLLGLQIETKMLASIWTDTLYPALAAVWQWAEANLLPMLNTMRTVELAGIKSVVGEVASAWTETLYPALAKVVNYIITGFKASFEMTISLVRTVVDAIGSISNAVQGALDWLIKLAAGMTSLPRINVAASIEGLGNLAKTISDAVIAAVKKMIGDLINPFQTGTMNYPGGIGLVGEQGPELVSLPQGSRIYPAGATSSIINNYNINANYAHQGERSLRSDIRFLQLVGAV